jgi:hypothetical protein
MLWFEINPTTHCFFFNLFIMKVLSFAFMLILASQSWACDICSSAFEVIPNERKSSFGVYYSTIYRLGYPQVQLKHSGHLNLVGAEVKEIFNVYDVRYRHAFSDRVFGEIILPLRNNYQGLNRSKRFDRWGLGDIQVLGTYRLIQPNPESRVNHRLDLTLGADMPSGSWTDSINQVIIDPVYQFGSGSFDFWLSASYIGRIDKFGYSVNGMYRRNTNNALHFKFGDALVGDVSMFFILDFDAFKIMPRTGVFYEQGFASKYRGLEDLHSGERMISSQHGLSFFYKQFQFNALIRHVLHHKSRGVEVRQKYFGQFALIYNF